MKTSRILRLLLLALGLLILSQIETACSKSERVHQYGEAPPASAPLKEAATAKSPATEAARKIIVARTVSVEVTDVAAVFDKVVKLAESSGGYTVNTNQFRNPDGALHGSIKMRVPAGKAGTVIDEIRKLGKVIGESSSGEDITEQYIDLEARLKNSRASESRLQKMMETKTGKLDDVLAVERELTRVRGEIESMEASKRNWDTLTRTVEITVELSEPPRAMPAVRKVWNPIKTAFGEAIEGFANSLHYAIVFIGAVIPWLVVMAAFGYIVVWLIRRRKKNQADKQG